MDPDSRRLQILEEMLKLCVNQHYASISMRQLAAACDVNMALLYHYFASKDDLIHATLSFGLDALMSSFRNLPRDPDAPLGDADAWLRATADAAPRVMQTVKLLNDFTSENRNDAVAEAMIKGFYDHERGTLERAITRGIEEGRFRPVDAERTARLASLTLDGVFFGGRARNETDVLENIRDLREHLLDHLTPPA